MGLFDKIKDNAKNISVRAIEEAQNEGLQVAPETAAAGDQSEPVDEGQIITPDETNEDTQPGDDKNSDSSEANTKDSDAEDEPAANEKAEDTKDEPAEEPRKSKITEVSKSEASKSDETKKDKPKKDSPKSEKQSEKQEEPKSKDNSSKTAASASGKTGGSYQPHYKMKPNQVDDITPPAKPSQVTSAKGKVIDVTPHKSTDAKQAIYARERATLAVLASQRRMNGSVPLYVTSHLKFKTRVFIDRIEYSGSFGKNVLPIEQVAWVKLRSGGTGVIIETAEGKRVVMVVKPADRLNFADAVLKVQSMQPKREKFKDTKTVRLDQLEQFGEGIDELEKLAKLYEKGIITQEEFEAKKKQILGL